MSPNTALERRSERGLRGGAQLVVTSCAPSPVAVSDSLRIGHHTARTVFQNLRSRSWAL